MNQPTTPDRAADVAALDWAIHHGLDATDVQARHVTYAATEVVAMGEHPLEQAVARAANALCAMRAELDRLAKLADDDADAADAVARWLDGYPHRLAVTPEPARTRALAARGYPADALDRWAAQLGYADYGDMAEQAHIVHDYSPQPTIAVTAGPTVHRHAGGPTDG